MGGVVALGGKLRIAATTGGPEADIGIQEPCGVFDTFILPVKLIQLCYQTILHPIKNQLMPCAPGQSYSGHLTVLAS
jgi:hypothetical protein